MMLAIFTIVAGSLDSMLVSYPHANIFIVCDRGLPLVL